MNKLKTILWDFDGVIIDSNSIRDLGFRSILKAFDKEKVEELIKYHQYNGGLSRYIKIRYFYNEIMNIEISDTEVKKLAEEFSVIMKKKLTDKTVLINDSVNFIKKNYNNYNFHIVSGSDQAELRFLCKKLGLSEYFKSIHGSPTPKNELVLNLLNNSGYSESTVCLIGDSINDYEAAQLNGIKFFGYNNKSLESKSSSYIKSFDAFFV